MTTIEWTDETWNPTRGCRRISLGCGGPRNEGGCYAERQAIRFAGPGGRYEGLVEMTANGPRWTGVGRLAPEMLDRPLHWRAPRMIFVDSMSDLFYEAFSMEDIAEVYAIMLLGFQHTYQILTKRADRMRAILTDERFARLVMKAAPRWYKQHPGISTEGIDRFVYGSPPPWIWHGISAENQPALDERAPELLRTPVGKRFISYEPALGPLDARDYLPGAALPRALHHHRRTGHDCGGYADQASCDICRIGFGPEDPAIDWVICGAESGPRNRPMDPDWARSIRDQCVDAGVPFMLKQFATPNGKKNSLPQLDGKQWAQIPERDGVSA